MPVAVASAHVLSPLRTSAVIVRPPRAALVVPATATEELKIRVPQLTAKAVSCGFRLTPAGSTWQQGDVVQCNIGDTSGIPEFRAIKIARQRVMERMNASTGNPNPYTPYPGKVELRDFRARNLLRHLQIPEDKLACFKLAPGEDIKSLVILASGTVSSAAGIYAEVKMHKLIQNDGRDVKIAMDKTHYWKHDRIARDLGKAKFYEFMTVKDGALMLDASQVQAFGADDGGVMVLNLGNPAAFTPTEANAREFVTAIETWNEGHPGAEISVVIDDPYAMLDGHEGPGFRLGSLALQSKVRTVYSHARTKEEFQTGSRGGEVTANHPATRRIMTQYKNDYAGSESTTEQLISEAIFADADLHAQFEREQIQGFKKIQERKKFFLTLLTRFSTLNAGNPVGKKLRAIIQDSKPFLREKGAFYVFLNCKSLCSKTRNSDTISELLASYGAVTVPGILFDADRANPSGLNKDCVRLSFARFDEASWRDQVFALTKAIGATCKVVCELDAQTRSRL